MLSVVFLGNWGLGLEVLKALHQSQDANVSLAVSRFDRSNKDVWYNAAYFYALEHSIPVYNEKGMDLNKLRELLERYKPDLMVTHAFMKMLPKEVFSVPRLGTVNIHASLLPAYRGPAPSYWVLHNKEKKTGLTAHFMDEGVDTGPIICQKGIKINASETMPALLDKLKSISSSFVNTMLRSVMKPGFSPIPQNENLATYAPKTKNKDI